MNKEAFKNGYTQRSLKGFEFRKKYIGGRTPYNASFNTTAPVQAPQSINNTGGLTVSKDGKSTASSNKVKSPQNSFKTLGSKTKVVSNTTKKQFNDFNLGSRFSNLLDSRSLKI